MNSCYLKISMERKQKRLYYFPQTSGLSKYVIENEVKCVWNYSRLLWNNKKERQPSLEHNSLFLYHAYLCNFVFTLFMILHLCVFFCPSVRKKENNSFFTAIFQTHWPLANELGLPALRQWLVIPSFF